MTALLIALWFWSFDRVEPPWAVLVGDDGAVVEVPVDQLPSNARPGDRLRTPAGPVVGDREARRARIVARLARLAGLASTSPVGHRSAVSRRRPDHFARRAQREGYAARSVYKLEEIDRRVGLIRRGMRVLDLGCSPGSWLQYAAAAVGPKGRVVGLDLKPVEVAGGAHVRAEVADAFETPPDVLLEWGGGAYDLVLSDMAPATSGNRLADHARSIDLCRRALSVAEGVLTPGGAFVCKVFEGEDAPALADDVRQRFERFKRIKPKGTRSESVELFFVAQGFRAGQGDVIALPPEVVATMASSGLSVEVFEGLRRRLVEGGWSPEENRVRGVVEAPRPGDVASLPADVSALRARGEQALRDGQVGIVLLNGGMATRFGERVKGVVEVTEGRSFLGLKVRDAARAAGAVGGPPVPVMLMNSRATTDATARHLEARAYFGHPPASVWTFEQQWAVRLEPSGDVFRERDGRPSYYGPGHGDLPGCLTRSGLLDRFEAAGGRFLLMSNVDNAAATLDPVLLGWHIESGGGLTVEVVDKQAGDVGGAPWRVDGRPQIVETFRLPVGVDPDASSVFNTNTLWFRTEALRAPAALTWLMVRKKAGGRQAVQFERLVGELSASVDTRFVRVPRVGAATRFVPVKTPQDLAANRAWLAEAWGSR